MVLWNKIKQLVLGNRPYNPSEFSGKGYKVLEKNIQTVGGVKKNILTSVMINQPNTIYEIRYDFDLNGEEITIPKECILKFNGGSLNNGKIIGNKTNLITAPQQIFGDTLSYGGGINFKEFDIRWFGAKELASEEQYSNEKDCAAAFQKAVDWQYHNCYTYIKVHGRYCLGKTIEVIDTLNIWGDASAAHNYMDTDGTRPKEQTVASSIIIKPGTTTFYLKGRGNGHNCFSVDIRNMRFFGDYGYDAVNGWQDHGWIGEKTVLIYSDVFGAPARPFKFIDNYVLDFYKAIDFEAKNADLYSQIADISILRNTFMRCEYAITMIGGNNTVAGCHCTSINENLFEACHHNFNITGAREYIEIKNNLIQVSVSDSISISQLTHLDLIGNYWEGVIGDFNIAGFDKDSSVRIVNGVAYNNGAGKDAYIKISNINILELSHPSGKDEFRFSGIITFNDGNVDLTHLDYNTFTDQCILQLNPNQVHYIYPPFVNGVNVTRGFISNGKIHNFGMKTALNKNKTILGTRKGSNIKTFYSFYKSKGFMSIKGENDETESVIIPNDEGFYIVCLTQKDNIEASGNLFIFFNILCEVSNVVAFTPTMLEGDDKFFLGSMSPSTQEQNYGDSTNRKHYDMPGTCYFDTTLNKPIYWIGTKWVDATGADV